MSVLAAPDNTALRVAQLVAGLWVMPAETLFRATRGGGAESHARHELYWLLHTACGLSIERVGEALGRRKDTVSHGVKKIEDALDDDGYAFRMERLGALAAEYVAIGALQDEAIAANVALEVGA